MQIKPHIAIPFIFFLFFSSAYAKSSDDKNWKFKVFLDGDEIGYHYFSVIQKDRHKEVYTTARFDVKILFITVYSYEHDNVEHWNDQCLNRINAITNDNGDIFQVNGKISDNIFIIETENKKHSASSCIKTFAYWDPSFLKEKALLNSQTGEMIEIETKLIGNENFVFKSNEVTAKRYRILGDNLQIDLWYSMDDHWLALESLTENGNVVRYTAQ